MSASGLVTIWLGVSALFGAGYGFMWWVRERALRRQERRRQEFAEQRARTRATLPPWVLSNREGR